MAPKLLSVISYLIIAGLLYFLVMMLLEPKSGSDAATRGIGKTMTLLAVAAVVLLVVYHLPVSNWIKYLGLAVGLLCAAALVVVLLALSGSSLVFQDTRTPYKPFYDDPVLTELFESFHEGNVRKWKSLLQTHPDYLHHKQLLKDVMYDANADKRSSGKKLAALQYVLESGAKIDSSLCTELGQFAYTGKTDFAELLLKHGADPNGILWDGSKTILFYVIDGYYNDDAPIELLIRYGADVNVKIFDEERQDTITPLSYAVDRGQWRCSMTLMKHGADLNFRNKAGVSIREIILNNSKDTENAGYYDVPEFWKLVEQVKK